MFGSVLKTVMFIKAVAFAVITAVSSLFIASKGQAPTDNRELCVVLQSLCQHRWHQEKSLKQSTVDTVISRIIYRSDAYLSKA